MQTYVEAQLENARHLRDLILRTMDQYWTPFEGHKVSLRSSIQKWQDFLFLAQSGQRSAASGEEQLVYFQLECVVATQLKDWQAAA